MSDFLLLVEGASLFAVGAVVLAVINEPGLVVSGFRDASRKRDADRAKVQSELDRKTAIADAAIAARARGESYTPPANYDR